MVSEKLLAPGRCRSNIFPIDFPLSQTMPLYQFSVAAIAFPQIQRLKQYTFVISPLRRPEVWWAGLFLYMLLKAEMRVWWQALGNICF